MSNFRDFRTSCRLSSLVHSLHCVTCLVVAPANDEEVDGELVGGVQGRPRFLRCMASFFACDSMSVSPDFLLSWAVSAPARPISPWGTLQGTQMAALKDATLGLCSQCTWAWCGSSICKVQPWEEKRREEQS